MIQDDKPNLTPISTLGEFGLIDHLRKITQRNLPDTILGIGDDAAIVKVESGHHTVATTDMLVENVHFDFAYVPPQHLGFKSISVNVSDLVAMGAKPTSVLVSISASSRMSLEAVEAIYRGMQVACETYGIEIVGGDTTSSLGGLTICITALGTVADGKEVRRSTAKANDLIVVTGDLGAAYMGLQILEREKAVFLENPYMQPDLSEYTYLIERQLRPKARVDVWQTLNELGVKPTSMLDVSDGLSSEVLHICRQSGLGCKIYEEKIPIDPAAFKACEEMQLNATTAALNGGEDYELVFTISLEDHKKIQGHMDFSVIGHMTEDQALFVSNAGDVLELKAQGWGHF